MTIGEICKGIAALPTGYRRDALQHWLDTVLRSWFDGRILAVTQTEAERWGRLAGAARQRGITLAVVDGVIAATAIENDLVIATRNVKDFVGLGVALVNPWDPPAET